MNQRIEPAGFDLGEVVVQNNVAATMRDGVILYADVYRPRGEGPFPVLLMRVPYGKTLAQSNLYHHPAWFARRGYLVVVQDTRGRWFSEGTFRPYRDEARDGYDTVEWAAALPSSNGRVGMYGLSYSGTTQLMAALAQPPHLVAIAPTMTSVDFYKYKAYRGGELALAFNVSWAANLSGEEAHRRGLGPLENDLYSAHFGREMWRSYGHLPISEIPLIRREIAPYFFEWLEHDTYDDYWKETSIEASLDRIQVPCLHLGGWYDLYTDSTVRAFVGLRARGGGLAREHQRLVMSPWSHGPSWSRYVGDLDLGPEAEPAVNEALVRWYDYWLKGEANGVLADPPVRLFTLGENRWRDHAGWPPSGARRVPFYLRSDGAANTSAGSGRLSQEPPAGEPPDVYVYNPRNPVPSFGGRTEVDAGRNPLGPFDHRRVETRNDILVYSTGPLDRPLEVAGPITATLYAASSAEDTDFTVKLLDVWPDGRAFNLADSILRASCRESLERPTPIEPYRVYRYDLEVGMTDNVFLAGHRIRVEVSSSNFPAYARNPNAFVPVGRYDLGDAVYAAQFVYHDARYPSHVVLPVGE